MKIYEITKETTQNKTTQNKIARMSRKQLMDELREFPAMLRFVSEKRRTDELCKIAIYEEPNAIQWILNPSEDLQIYALYNGANPFLINNKTDLVNEVMNARNILYKCVENDDVHAAQEKLYDKGYNLVARNIMKILKICKEKSPHPKS